MQRCSGRRRQSNPDFSLNRLTSESLKVSKCSKPTPSVCRHNAQERWIIRTKQWPGSHETWSNLASNISIQLRHSNLRWSICFWCTWLKRRTKGVNPLLRLTVLLRSGTLQRDFDGGRIPNYFWCCQRPWYYSSNWLFAVRLQAFSPRERAMTPRHHS